MEEFHKMLEYLKDNGFKDHTMDMELLTGILQYFFEKQEPEQLALCSVGKQSELLNRFVREWNKEVSKDDEMYCIDDRFVNEFKKTI